MLKWFMRRKLAAFERQRAYDASYLHEVLDVDSDAFLRFGRAVSLGRYRKDVPHQAYFAATLTSSLRADCGPCTQLGVGFALEAGVPASVVTAIVAGDVAALPAEAALGVRFARAVLAHAPEVDACREAIVKRWGPRAVLSLAFGIMAAQLYPTLKYALGHGKACARIDVAGTVVSPSSASGAA